MGGKHLAHTPTPSLHIRAGLSGRPPRHWLMPWAVKAVSHAVLRFLGAMCRAAPAGISVMWASRLGAVLQQMNALAGVHIERSRLAVCGLLVPAQAAVTDVQDPSNHTPILSRLWEY